jgi:micrococcal nuclease
MKRTILAAGGLLVFVLVATTAAAQSGPAPAYDAVVTRVMAGDTIQVRFGDRLETVRYIGINTPEIHHPTRGWGPTAVAARAANQRLVEGQTVRLVLDVQPRDRDGRLLAYVYAGGRLVNAELVRSGYAEAATAPPNVKHHAELVELQRQARRERAGLWADPDAVRAYRPRLSGVAGVKNVQVFLHPDDPGWRQRAPEDLRYFETAEEARAAGYTPSMDYRELAARERQALAGGPEPFITLSQAGRSAMPAPKPAGRQERPQPEASEAEGSDPSAVVDWLLNRPDKGANVKGETPGRK